jgi:S-sulfosulfanyl-L-cysteine sulfohydrolase
MAGNSSSWLGVPLSLGLVAVALALAASSCHPAPAPSSASVSERSVTLLFFADAHADLETHPELFWKASGESEIVPAGGYARMATVAKAVKAETGGRALLIDAGDTFQGASVATWTRGEVVVEPQRALGVDLGIPGNWEVVYGAARMKELAQKTGYPWLATNVVDEATGQLVFPPTLVRDVGGVRVGFVGFTDPDVPVRQAPSYSRGLRFLGAESIAAHVKTLRERDHAELVVLITHIGLPRAVELAEHQAGIDLVLSGDTHERTPEPIVRNGVPIVEPGAFASLLGRIDITLRPGARPTFAWRLHELRADKVPEDPAVAAVVANTLAPYRARMDEVIGHAGAPLERYGVVENTADDVLVSALKSHTGADIALSNGFRFGHPIAAGPITEGDLGRLYPLTGIMKVGQVGGAQFRAWLEAELDHVFADDPRRLFGGWVVRMAGVSVHFRANAPAGARITSLLIGDKPLDDAATYTIATCEREGDPPDTMCRIKGVANVKKLDVDNHVVVREHLARSSPVGAKLRRAVVADDLPERVYSQYYRK